MARLAQAFAGLLAVANAAWPVQKYNTESFTAPAFQVEGDPNSTIAGPLFLGYTKTADDLMAPMIFENNGDLVWHGPTGGPVHNFRRQLLDNQQVLTYWTGYLSNSGHGYGNVLILDKNYKQIYNVCLPESENSQVVYDSNKQFPGNRQNPCFVDKHESYITDAGTILITLYNITQTDLSSVGGSTNGYVYNCIFYEMDPKTQNIVFKWSALDHVDVSDSNFVNGTGSTSNRLNLDGKMQGTKKNPWDFFHINSVQKITGGYLVNSRMFWSFYRLDNNGNKMWTLEGSNGGDFTLGPGIFFSWEHMPRLDPQASTDDTLVFSVFNNDNIPKLAEGVNSSSGYILSMDTKAMHVTAVHDLLPKNKINGVAEGSVQTLDDDHNLVGWGSTPLVSEYSGNNLIWSAQFGDGNEKAHSYRAYRFNWTTTPNTKPKAAAMASGSSTMAYMSWNGATAYDSWNVYAGNTKKSLSKVASGVAKNGFETSAKIQGTGNKFVQVEALSGSKSLKKSAVVKVSGSTASKPQKSGSTSSGSNGGLLGGILGGGGGTV